MRPWLAAALLWGCAGADDRSKRGGSVSDTAVEVDPDWVTPIFAEHCAGCHGGEAPDASLDLSGDVRAALVNVPSLQIDGPLVQPGDRMESYLWIKLEGRMALVDGYGTAMPPQGPLSQSERETLGGWIDAGAP